MNYLDAALVNLTEHLCRRFQLLTGRTNVWLAFQLTNLSIIVYFVWAGVQFWTNEGAPRLFLIVFCTGLMWMLSQTVFKVPIEAHETSAYQRVAKGLRNPRRVRDMLLRLPFLTLSILLAYPVFAIYRQLGTHIIGLTYLLVVLTTVVLYLLACDPLPPAPGKVREWLRAVVPSRVAPSESPLGE